MTELGVGEAEPLRPPPRATVDRGRPGVRLDGRSFFDDGQQLIEELGLAARILGQPLPVRFNVHIQRILRRHLRAIAAREEAEHHALDPDTPGRVPARTVAG